MGTAVKDVEAPPTRRPRHARTACSCPLLRCAARSLGFAHPGPALVHRSRCPGGGGRHTAWPRSPTSGTNPLLCTGGASSSSSSWPSLFHLMANRALGLYGRMWRHAGIEEARQVILACLVVFLLLVPLRPLWHMVRLPVARRVASPGCAARRGPPQRHPLRAGLHDHGARRTPVPLAPVRLATRGSAHGTAGCRDREPRRRCRRGAGDVAEPRSGARARRRVRRRRALARAVAARGAGGGQDRGHPHRGEPLRHSASALGNPQCLTQRRGTSAPGI